MTTSNQRQYATAWILLLALFTALGPLSIDMYLPALPLMAQSYEVSIQMMANTLPAYFLGLAIGQLIYGPLSDRIGRKKPLYFGMALFTVASLGCALAPNEWFLMIFRVLQALGGCVGVVMARAAIRDCLDVQGSAQAFSSMMMVMGLAPILAPIIGAQIIVHWQWPAIFIALMLIGLFCFLSVHFWFKETLASEHRLALSVGQVFGLYFKILSDKSFRQPMLAGSLTGGALFAYISSAGAVMMGQFQISEQNFAYLFALNAFGIMLLSALNKRLIPHTAIMTRLKLGALVQLSGAVLVILASFSAHALWWAMLGMFLAVAGIGLTGPNSMTLAMSKQGERAGSASALMGSMQFACGLLGGLVLNFLAWSALLNMGILLFFFTLLGSVVIWKMASELKKTTIKNLG
ncbi:Bcr/CflA family drug resistance efflux transporter [Acinetobacter larvae]|uniref:Bcr/CflA family efflux transporter n=2 Tax=Acinetobacter larvae TaxID=1789224 RepID=A0A1B2LWU6_9GAMM|nr:Bcr/CflA family drug resistance efflux transporter [Acinetobacter larvae]